MEDATQIIRFIRVAGIPPALLVILITAAIARFLARSGDRLGARFTERRLLVQQSTTILRFLIYFIGIGMATLLVFRLSDQMLLALGGTLAVAAGIALKDLVASIMAGLIILSDRPFQVGDRVSFGGYYGEITRIGLRSVRLVTLDDNLITIPNNKFLTDPASSGNAGALDMLVQMDFHVDVEADIDAARSVVRDALLSCRFTYLAKPWNVLLNQVVVGNYVALRLRAKVYVLDVQYEKALESDVTERVLRGFRQAGVRPPAVLHRQRSAGRTSDAVRQVA